MGSFCRIMPANGQMSLTLPLMSLIYIFVHPIQHCVPENINVLTIFLYIAPLKSYYNFFWDTRY